MSSRDMETDSSVPDAMPVRFASWQWLVWPASRGLLEGLMTRWETLEELPGARIEKSNLARTVVALPATGDRPGLHIKRYQVRGWTEQVKYLLMPSRALDEWRALHHFRRQGIPAPRPVAFGEERSGGILRRAGLIMESIVDAVPLPRWLERNQAGTSPRVALLRGLGEMVARMHGAGVDHGDLHAGNLLVRERPGADDEVCIIDLHTCRIGGVVPEARRRANLGKLVHSFGDRVHHRETLALIEGYAGSGSVPPWPEDHHQRVCEDLERRAARVERIRLGSRARRCWKNTTEFRSERRDGWKVNRRKEVDASALDGLMTEDPELSPVFKERPGHRVGVTRIDLDGRSTPVVVKLRRHRSLIKRIVLRLGLPGPLETAWWAARALEVRGIPTPRALALLRCSRRGLPHVSILVTEYLESAVTLRDDLLARYYPRPRADGREIGARVRELAELVRRLHDSGIYHRDLNPMNYLVPARGTAADLNGAARFQLVDLDSVRARQRLTRRRRCKNLVQLALIPEGHIVAADRLRFLRAYDRGEGRYWNRTWIAIIDRMLAQETIRIMARISAKERLHALDPEVCDPRFRQATRDLTHPFDDAP